MFDSLKGAGSWISLLLIAAWAMLTKWFGVQNQLKELAKVSTDHEKRIRVMEASSAEVKADVRWIRKAIEKMTDSE